MSPYFYGKKHSSTQISQNSKVVGFSEQLNRMTNKGKTQSTQQLNPFYNPKREALAETPISSENHKPLKITSESTYAQKYIIKRDYRVVARSFSTEKEINKSMERGNSILEQRLEKAKLDHKNIQTRSYSQSNLKKVNKTRTILKSTFKHSKSPSINFKADLTTNIDRFLLSKHNRLEATSISKQTTTPLAQQSTSYASRAFIVKARTQAIK